MKLTGTVALVGAGPGDAGLMTLRGAELLGRADVVVYDALVAPSILKLAPAAAERIYAGKRSRDHAIPQGELNQLLVAKARQGKRIVRLKGGDPFLFGRGGEEAEELAAAGIPFEIVPGVTSAIAAPAYAGIPVTHREHCSSVTFLTGHEDPGKAVRSIDWKQLATDGGTKVILMGIERLPEIVGELVGQGMSADTPAAVVQWGTTGRQRSVVSTLGGLVEAVGKAGITAPAVTVVGSVVRLREKLNWFEKRPLFGKRVVVTRTRDQASKLSHALLERGAEVLEIPTIRVQPPREVQPLIEAIAGLGEYDWLIFTSPNGVTAFFGYFFKAFDDLRALGNQRIAAVGPATAEKLKELHLRVDVIPDEFVGARIADAIAKHESIENLRLLLLRAETANPEIVQKLEELGGIVDDVSCYATVPETEDPSGELADLVENGADWITFTSASTVDNFNARVSLKDLMPKFPQLRLATIGPETTKALMRLGYAPAVEAKPHTIAGLVEALTRAVGAGAG